MPVRQLGLISQKMSNTVFKSKTNTSLKKMQIPFKSLKPDLKKSKTNYMTLSVIIAMS